jgi:hypothetical protein
MGGLLEVEYQELEFRAKVLDRQVGNQLAENIIAT